MRHVYASTGFFVYWSAVIKYIIEKYINKIGLMPRYICCCCLSASQASDISAALQAFI
jgi:hypothetical protein